MIDSALKNFPFLLSKNMIMLLVDTADGKILDANEGALNFYGYTLDEIKERSVQDITVLPKGQAHYDFFKAGDDESDYAIYRHRKANGITANVEIMMETVNVEDRDVNFYIIQDVTKHQSLIANYMDSLQLYQAVYNYVGDMILLLELNEMYEPLGIIEVNQRTINRLKYSEAELIGQPITKLMYSMGQDQYRQVGCDLKEVGETDFYTDLMDKAGDRIPVYVSLRVIDYGNRKIVIGSGRDLSIEFNLQKDLDVREKRIIELIYTDSLTGLKNRSYFTDVLHSMIDDAYIENSAFSIVYLDLDNFKMINDAMGHSFGDDVLIRFSECLKEVFEGIGIIGRIGGDEFAILIKETTESVIDYYIGDLIERLNNPFYIEGKPIRLLFSAGIAKFPLHGETAEILLKNADIAMYKAKSYSGMSYMYYSPHYSDHIARELYIENLVISGIERNEFYMVYQPIVSRKDGKIAGLEALVRWQTLDNGVINPDEFIPICEKNGTIKELGRWILERSIKDLILINSALDESLFISINVSTVQLFDDSLLHILNRIIDADIIKPELIELEITETAYMQDFNKMKGVLSQLKSLGVKIVIDDFGTGYSSFHQLVNLDIDKLKVDQSFIKKVVTSEKHLSLVAGILSMAYNLGIEVVCEGIEINDQLYKMNEISWTYGQGYVFSKPIIMEDFIQDYQKYLELLVSLLSHNTLDY